MLQQADLSLYESNKMSEPVCIGSVFGGNLETLSIYFPYWSPEKFFSLWRLLILNGLSGSFLKWCSFGLTKHWSSKLNKLSNTRSATILASALFSVVAHLCWHVTGRNVSVQLAFFQSGPTCSCSTCVLYVCLQHFVVSEFVALSAVLWLLYFHCAITLFLLGVSLEEILKLDSICTLFDCAEVALQDSISPSC